MTEGTRPCREEGCGGSIGSTGFCDRCGLPLTGSEGDRGPTPSSAAHRFEDADLYALDEVPQPDPLVGLDENPRVPFDRRWCATCRGPVGRPTSAEPEGLDKGVCEADGTPYSFSALRVGEVVDNRYEVRGAIARGGYGWVYLAHDRQLGNYVALKGQVYAADEAAQRLARNEVRRLTQLEHHSLVRIVTVAEPPRPELGRLLVLDYVPGVTLEEMLTTARSTAGSGVGLDLVRVVRYGLSLLVALGYLHGRGMLYCDLKPENVIHSGTEIKLVDMGALRDIDDHTSPYIGTEGYRIQPEEQDATQGPTVRSDLYSLGCTLRTLYPRYPRETGAGDPRRRLAEDFFHEVVARATAPFDDRFVDAEQMYYQLDGVLRDLLALESGSPSPVRSQIFNPSPGLFGAGLAEAPSVDELTAPAVRGPLPLPDHRSDLLAAVTTLPAPRTSADDDACDYLSQVRAPNPERLLAKLRTEGRQTAETLLAQVRVQLETGEPEDASATLGRVRTGSADGWRVQWHKALVAMARGNLGAAEKDFEAVARHWPGEAAPKLAVARCLDCQGRPQDADRWYGLVAARDQHEAGAAFGLARVHVAEGRRAEAVAALDRVRSTSRHYDQARLAMLRVWCADLPHTGWPEPDDVAAAVAELPGVYLDDETGDRLATAIWLIAHHAAATGDERYWARARPLIEASAGRAGSAGRGAVDRLVGRVLARGYAERNPAVILRRPVPEAAALALARAFHRLSRRATDADERSRLLDRAHAVRPATWL